MKLIKKAKYTFSNIYIMAWRSIVNSLRTTDILVATFVIPIIIMLIIYGLFGKAVDTSGVKYINYLVPGILIVCICYGASNNAVKITTDLRKGVIDRFRSMPIARSSFLTGHVIASTLLNALSIALTIFVAFLLGFEPESGIGEWLLIIGILFLFTFTMIWISMVVGLIARSPESAQAFGFIFQILPYFSSALVPTEDMHFIIRVFSQYQPINSIILTMRSLFMNQPPGNTVLIAVLWCAGLVAVFYLLAMSLYHKKTA